MKSIIVPDTAIVTVTHNGADNIIYRDSAGKLHVIDFESCAGNFRTEHENCSNRCVGERKIDEGYFVFYTSPIKTQVVIKKAFVLNPFQCPFLTGTRSARFHAIQKFIIEAGYTTFDLSLHHSFESGRQYPYAKFSAFTRRGRILLSIYCFHVILSKPRRVTMRPIRAQNSHRIYNFRPESSILLYPQIASRRLTEKTAACFFLPFRGYSGWRWFVNRRAQ